MWIFGFHTCRYILCMETLVVVTWVGFHVVPGELRMIRVCDCVVSSATFGICFVVNSLEYKDNYDMYFGSRMSILLRCYICHRNWNSNYDSWLTRKKLIPFPVQMLLGKYLNHKYPKAFSTLYTFLRKYILAIIKKIIHCYLMNVVNRDFSENNMNCNRWQKCPHTFIHVVICIYTVDPLRQLWRSR